MRRATVGVSAISAVALGIPRGLHPTCRPSLADPTRRLAKPGAPPPAVKERRSVTAVQVNTCNGETVHLAGELREDTKVKDSRVEQRITAHLTGTGDLGNEYKFELDVESKWDTATMTMTQEGRQLLVTKGSAPDLRVTVTISSSPLSIEGGIGVRGRLQERVKGLGLYDRYLSPPARNGQDTMRRRPRGLMGAFIAAPPTDSILVGRGNFGVQGSLRGGRPGLAAARAASTNPQMTAAAAPAMGPATYTQ